MCCDGIKPCLENNACSSFHPCEDTEQPKAESLSQEAKIKQTLNPFPEGPAELDCGASPFQGARRVQCWDHRGHFLRSRSHFPFQPCFLTYLEKTAVQTQLTISGELFNFICNISECVPSLRSSKLIYLFFPSVLVYFLSLYPTPRPVKST